MSRRGFTAAAAQLLAGLLLAGCFTVGPEVIMPGDPNFARVCDVENPPPECWSDAAVLDIRVDYHVYPWDTIG